MANNYLIRPIAAAATVLFAASASWALDTKPHIIVSFQLESANFRDNLPQLETLQANISREVATKIAQRHAFIDWTLAPGADAARLGVLVLKLTEDPNTVPSPRIDLKWFGGADAATAKELTIPVVEVYSATNPNWDTNNRANFETRVLTKLRVAMNDQAFYDMLFKEFVRKLPIAKQALASATERAIDVPVNWSQMRVAPESRVMIIFRPTGGDEGQLTLNPVITRSASAVDADASPVSQLRGAVSAVRVGIRTLPLVDNWNDQLPVLLRNAQVTCFLDDYKPLDFVGTSGDLVLNPR